MLFIICRRKGEEMGIWESKIDDYCDVYLPQNSYGSR